MDAVYQLNWICHSYGHSGHTQMARTYFLHSVVDAFLVWFIFITINGILRQPKLRETSVCKKHTAFLVSLTEMKKKLLWHLSRNVFFFRKVLPVTHRGVPNNFWFSDQWLDASLYALTHKFNTTQMWCNI